MDRHNPEIILTNEIILVMTFLDFDLNWRIGNLRTKLVICYESIEIAFLRI